LKTVYSATWSQLPARIAKVQFVVCRRILTPILLIEYVHFWECIQ
jgi:hypothetical protein